jgi:hypothetical protein
VWNIVFLDGDLVTPFYIIYLFSCCNNRINIIMIICVPLQRTGIVLVYTLTGGAACFRNSEMKSSIERV